MFKIVLVYIVSFSLFAGGEIGIVPRFFPDTRTLGLTSYATLYTLYRNNIYLNPYVSYSHFPGIFNQFYGKFDVNRHRDKFIYGVGIGIDNIPTYNINRTDIHVNLVYKFDF